MQEIFIKFMYLDKIFFKTLNQRIKTWKGLNKRKKKLSCV